MSSSNNQKISSDKDNQTKNKIITTIKETFTPTGNYEQDKARGEAYAKAVNMNKTNLDMAVIMATEGKDAAAKAMMESCDNDYALMRSRYG